MPMRESRPEWFTPVCLFGKHCDLLQLGVELLESFVLDAQSRERHHRQCRTTLVIPKIKARGWCLKGGNNVSFMVTQSGVVPASHSIACVVAIAVGGDHCIWKIFARRICSILDRLRFCGCCLRDFRMVHAQWAILGAPSPQASGMRQDSNLPISGLRMGVREIAHLADFASLFIGFLWPLWDGRGQTFADKIMGTTVTRKQ